MLIQNYPFQDANKYDNITIMTLYRYRCYRWFKTRNTPSVHVSAWCQILGFIPFLTISNIFDTTITDFFHAILKNLHGHSERYHQIKLIWTEKKERFLPSWLWWAVGTCPLVRRMPPDTIKISKSSGIAFTFLIMLRKLWNQVFVKWFFWVLHEALITMDVNVSI